MTATFKKATYTLIVSIAISLSTIALAAGTEEDEVPAGDWYSFVKMDLDNGYYESAMERLETVRAKNESSSADWNNYMGYTLRKQETPDLVAAEVHYKKALTLKTDHRGAMEYYGELKLLQKDLEGAKSLLTKLNAACPEGCDEFDKLNASIKEY